jgi:hypothetical protein
MRQDDTCNECGDGDKHRGCCCNKILLFHNLIFFFLKLRITRMALIVLSSFVLMLV